MRTRTPRHLPARLEGLRRRFDRWRWTRKGRSRIPEALWTAAVKAAGTYGLHRTAQTLRLDYYTLKRRLEAGGSHRVSGGKVASRHLSDPQAVATFVELGRPASGSARECILELADPGGAKIRVHLKGCEAPDLAALSRSFWGVET